MKADFTFKTYGELLNALQRQGFCFQTVEGFMRDPLQKVVILRHDVDRLPQNALAMARLEQELDVVSTYYFRAVPESWDEGIIREIASMGHEVGYHYENLSAVSRGKDFRKLKAPQYHLPELPQSNRFSEIAQGRRGRQSSKVDIFSEAFRDFKENLEKLRRLVPVKTICMHGSPLSSINNLDLWRRYDYREVGIIGEPYLDMDFDEVFYLTDTGRRWDGDAVSVRDKVKAQSSPVPSAGATGQAKLKGKRWPRFHSTFDIIQAVGAGRFPDKVMMTVHPQRWTDDPVGWAKELIAQNIKNVVKRNLVRRLRR